MQRLCAAFSLCVLLRALGAAALAQDAVEISYMRYQNGNECEICHDLLSRFSADNPGIALRGQP